MPTIPALRSLLFTPFVLATLACVEPPGELEPEAPALLVEIVDATPAGGVSIDIIDTASGEISSVESLATNPGEAVPASASCCEAAQEAAEAFCDAREDSVSCLDCYVDGWVCDAGSCVGGFNRCRCENRPWLEGGKCIMFPM